jgi:Methionine synthase I, cobalamin-binding domain
LEAFASTSLLATVKGDVHEIGKNLVDIILSNNGYSVVNIGIKQPIGAIIDNAIEHDVDAIGMSGLLVKSTVIMKENLEELNDRELAERFPIILGGAALTRAYVEQDLAAVYEGEVRYARNAFEGLSLMDAIMAVKRGEPGATLPQRRERRVPQRASAGRRDTPPESQEVTRSDTATDNRLPQPPFWGSRIVKGISLADYQPYLDHRALFLGQWGLKPTRDGDGFEAIVEREGLPRLRYWLDRIHTDDLITPAVAYGYFPRRGRGQ